MQALFDGALLRLPVCQTRLGGKVQVQPCPQCPVSDGRREKGGLSRWATRDSCTATKSVLFDHLVGAGEHCLRNSNT